MLPILDPRWHLFATVAQLGSLTRAADALNLPQSVISRQIGQLETQCGARLFRRTGRGVVLTDFGQTVQQRILPMIVAADQLADAILTTNGIPIGEVHVGLLPSSIPSFAGQLFRAARALPQGAPASGGRLQRPAGGVAGGRAARSGPAAA
nr:LysR family transcriptional regulator [Duganella lactea]